MSGRLKKKVTLCRSGIQMYHRSELLAQGIVPPYEKEWYKEKRPASVIIDAQDMMTELPVTVEHPSDGVDKENFHELIGGYTSSRIKVVSLDGGEIGIESDITFGSQDMYDYFMSGNNEVSLGYSANKRWAEESEDYDLILTKITSVNHLALTSAGRGGAQVSVHDSKGGNMEFRSQLFKDLNSEVSVSDALFDVLEKRGKKDKEDKKVLDSLLNDCPEEVKNIVQDSLENAEMALKNKDRIVSSIKDAMEETKEETKEEEEKAEAKDSEEEVEDACAETKDSEEEVEDACAEEKKEDVEDSDGRGTNTNDIHDSINEIVKTAVEEALKAKGLNFKEADEVEQNDSAAVIDKNITVDDVFSVIM